ncbi:TonB-dependent receptor [Kineobactrum salinum]|uniref:TonB-dependent receptor n=1 Tax=Kineobactrum salinum TaxID=2708301 RepID=A0A6C0U484_9GAMM|nr:TonB-dependent receptor [Kineobactrum salinum]QIB66836.1 TonB-dependent receptor [Kineobactrum salinum]
MINKYKLISCPEVLRLPVMSALVLNGLLPASGTYAAEVSVGALEEVVVTAQRREERLSEVPMSISAFTGTDMQLASINDTQGLSMKVPGLVYPASDNFAMPYIRGVGMAFAANGLEVPIATYIDDVYIQQQTGSIAQLVDLERVQVLKGPQGTLYGRNATGGAIVVNTMDPTEELEGYVRLGYGRFDSLRSEGVLNVPLSDTVSARVALQLFDRREGYIENVFTGNDLGEDKRVTARAKVAWRPSEATEVIGSFERFRGDDTINAHAHGEVSVCTGCAAYGVTPPSGFYEVFQDHETQTQSDADLSILRISHDFGNLEFYSVTSYREYVFSGEFDQDFTSAPLFVYSTRNESETIEQEFRLTSSFEGALNFAAGVFYEKDSTDAPAFLRGDAFGALVPGAEKIESKLDAAAVFGEIYYDLSDNWKFTLGGRYNRDDRSLEIRNNPDGVLVFGVEAFKLEDTFTDFTPRVVLAYNNDDVNLYASYNEGFKSGGYNSAVFTPPEALTSEKIKSYEIGGKFGLLDNRMRLNTSVFFYTYDDMQVTFYDPLTSALILRNAADSESVGVDFDLTWAATESLTIGFGGQYLDAEFKSFPNGSIYVPAPGALVPEEADLSGEPLPNAPEWSGFISADYIHPIGNGLELALGIVANYTDEYDFMPGAGGPLQLDRQESMTRVNATASIGSPDQGWSVMLWVENLTDKEYYNNRLATGFGDQLTMALPRMYGASVEWRF